MNQIYLDYAATTPLDTRVLEAMMPYFQDEFGNTSSIHAYGQRAEAALEDARETLAHGMNCKPGEVIFTACGSESDNLAVRGAALAAWKQRGAKHLLISPVEHHAVTRTAQQLADVFGFELELLPVDEFGMVDPQEVQRRLRPDTVLVSVIYANNEIGTINPIAEIGALCRAQNVLFHSDAVQAAAYLPVDVQALNVDLLALGAHKFYGPKGVGALYVRQGTPLLPTLTGGSQESGRRAGTHNVAYIAGMARAFELAQREREARWAALLPLRDRLIGQTLESVPDSRLSGHPTRRLPNHASFVFQNADGNALLMLLDLLGFACSSGSACKTGDPEPSDVLTAMGYPRDWALGSLRVTLGSGSTPEHIEKFTQALPEAVQRVRALPA